MDTAALETKHLAWHAGQGLLLLFAALVLGVLCGVLRLNMTPSAPRGLYWCQSLAPATPVPAGTWVLLRQSAYMQALVRLLGASIPPGQRLLKQVIAGAGEVWCQEDICQRIAPGYVALAGAHPRSFDSRVFGVIEHDLLVATATPVLTWR